MLSPPATTVSAPVSVDLAHIFPGNGAMAHAMRAFDWQSHPLGPPALWPEELKVATRILLTSRFETWLGWGDELYFFFNDAYRPTLGLKADCALGRPCREVWAEIWDDVKGRMDAVMQRGESTWDRALLLLLERSGYPEETYHTFSYSPLLRGDGSVGGLYCTVTEETDRVINERRLDAMRRLAMGLGSATSRAEAFDAAQAALQATARDLPFALAYTFADSDGTAELAFACGVASDTEIAPLRITLDDDTWPAMALWNGAGLQRTRLRDGGGAYPMPCGAWNVPAREALVLPLAASGDPQGSARPAGFVVAGLNPYKPLDGDYQAFIELLAGQLAAALDRAGAAEAQRRRAAVLAEASQMRQQAAEVLRRANRQLALEVATRTAERDTLRQLFEHSPSFVAVLRGPVHVFEMANASYLQLVGGRHVVGKPVSEALPEVVAQGFVELLDHVFRTGEPYIGRALPVMLQPLEGGPLEEHFLDFVYQPMLGLHGTTEGIFVEGHDVTDRVLGERAVRSLNETLEARIAERTHELAEALRAMREEVAAREVAQAALRQAQKMEAVGQLTGGIAHDFNNLLQGITGSLELLRRRMASASPEQVERYIEGAMKSARRAAALTHRLLAFSRRQPLDPKPVPPNPLIASIEDLLHRTLGEHIALKFDLQDDVAPILCDANQLESALLNLCINARDAMPDGGTLTILTRSGSEAVPQAADALPPGEYVAIAVSDTGIGMAPDVAARAFDPFFTTKPIGQGTGLGLSMIYGFARQSQGAARIQTSPGQGTTVTLLLPRHHGPMEEPAPSAQVASPAATGCGTVLVVEDEPAVRALVVEALAHLGCETFESADGAAALEQLRSLPHLDLLVTDMGLPGLNGRQLADAARVQRPQLRVLFMTGYADAAAAADGFLEPGMELITKPFSLDALDSTLRGLLGNAPQGTACS